MQRRASGAGVLLFLIITAVFLMGAWLYTGWQSGQRVLPAGVTMAGLPVNGMTRQQALNSVSQAFASTVTLYYEHEPVLLAPEMVDLTLDIEATAANLDAVLLAQAGPQGFLDYVRATLLNREAQVQDVQPVFSYSRARLDSFLERLAQQYDQSPQAAVLLPEAGTFRPAQPGTRLNIEASRPLVLATLLSASQREVALVVATESAPLTPVEVLAGALNGQLANFSGVAGIFIKDLATGQELCINCKVAFSGLNTLHIGIVAKSYHLLNAAPDQQTAVLLNAVLARADVAAADTLLRAIGVTDPYTGAQLVTVWLHSLGMVDTFITAPYNAPDEARTAPLVTAANSRTDINTAPDPLRQTTPLDTGLLLEALYQCSRGGGLLRVLYPDTLTTEECREILGGLGQNSTPAALAGDLPPGTRLAHNQGWLGSTYGNSAIVYSPRGDFVMSVFFYQPDWLTWEESTATFAIIGQLTYRFFNPQGE